MSAKREGLEARAEALVQLVEQLRETLALVGDELEGLRSDLADQNKPDPSCAQASSKRTTRKLSGFYLTPEIVDKLKRHVLERQEAGERVDASDVAEEALVALLQTGESTSHAQSLKPRGSAQMRQMENEDAVRAFIQASSGYAQKLLAQARANPAPQG